MIENKICTKKIKVIEKFRTCFLEIFCKLLEAQNFVSSFDSSVMKNYIRNNIKNVLQGEKKKKKKDAYIF